MADHELTPEEGLRLLDELFGSEDPNAPPTRGRRKYVLEHLDGEPVFRLAEVSNKPALPRDDFDVAFDEVMVELFGPDPDGKGMQLGRPFSRQCLGLLEYILYSSIL
jgi:hypothetical protein